jgi:hypothetical protein
LTARYHYLITRLSLAWERREVGLPRVTDGRATVPSPTFGTLAANLRHVDLIHSACNPATGTINRRWMDST